MNQWMEWGNFFSNNPFKPAYTCNAYLSSLQQILSIDIAHVWAIRDFEAQHASQTITNM